MNCHWTLIPLTLAAASTAAYHALLRERSPERAWRLGRLLLLLASLSMASMGLGLNPALLASSTAATLVGYHTAQLLLAHYFKNRTIGVVAYRLAGKTLRVHLLRSEKPAAFTLTALKTLYITPSLTAHLNPEDTLAIIAHEHGHAEAFNPLHPAIATTLAVTALSWALTTTITSTLTSPACTILLSTLTLWTWILYSWAWEHLADIYSLKTTGQNTIKTLEAITGAKPAENTLKALLASLKTSLKPRRIGPTITNPHPSPQLRLKLLHQLAKTQQQEHPENPSKPG